MYTVDGFNITIPREDSADLLFKLYDEDNQCPYILDGQQVRIDVFYETSTTYLISVTASAEDQDDDGTVHIFLTSENTSLERNKYRYVLRLIDGQNADSIIGFSEAVYISII